jgi:hypothetical protein
MTAKERNTECLNGSQFLFPFVEIAPEPRLVGSSVGKYDVALSSVDVPHPFFSLLLLRHGLKSIPHSLNCRNRLHQKPQSGLQLGSHDFTSVGEQRTGH